MPASGTVTAKAISWTPKKVPNRDKSRDASTSSLRPGHRPGHDELSVPRHAIRPPGAYLLSPIEDVPLVQRRPPASMTRTMSCRRQPCVRRCRPGAVLPRCQANTSFTPERRRGAEDACGNSMAVAARDEPTWPRNR